MIGWDEVAHVEAAARTPSCSSGVQARSSIARQPATKVILSPAHKIYLDMQYHTDTLHRPALGGLVDVPDAYTWDPATRPARRQGVVDPGHRGADLVGDAGDDAGRRVPRVSAAGRGCRDRVVAWRRPHVGRVQAAARRAGAALDGARDQCLLVTENRLAAIRRRPEALARAYRPSPPNREKYARFTGSPSSAVFAPSARKSHP